MSWQKIARTFPLSLRTFKTTQCNAYSNSKYR